MARYDGWADSYDAYITGEASAFTETVEGTLSRLLGEGSGLCLDVGCGTGIYLATVQALGWSVVGMDLSGDQLRVARKRLGVGGLLVQADGANLPFDDDSLDAAYATLIHTDVEDVSAIFGELGRVLRPDGQLVYVGTHPCFVGPFIERTDEGLHVLYPGYRQERWHTMGPGLGTAGIRSRVGVRHVPLGELLMAVLNAGLSLVAVEEVGDELPAILALSAAKPEGA